MINLGELDLANGMDMDYVLNNIVVNDYPIVITHLPGSYDSVIHMHNYTCYHGRYEPNDLFYLHNGYLICDEVNTRVVEFIIKYQNGEDPYDIGK